MRLYKKTWTFETTMGLLTQEGFNEVGEISEKDGMGPRKTKNDVFIGHDSWYPVLV
jgi:hypothetical protein